MCAFMLLHGFAGAAESPIRVFVSIAPQEFLVKSIGGERVEARVLVKTGQSPHTYEPTPKQLALLGEAALFIRIGDSFERGLMDKVQKNFPRLRIADQRDRVLLLTREGQMISAPGNRDLADPHVWLDPKRLKIQARTIAKVLGELDPAHQAYYSANLKRLEDELVALDSRLTTLLAPCKGRSFLVQHPAYGYFADSYGLRQEAIELGGKEPSGERLASIVDRVRRAELPRAIIVQPQIADRSARVVADATGSPLVTIDPLARDVLKTIEALGQTLARPCQQETR